MAKVDGIHHFMFVDVLSQVDVSGLGKQVALFDRARAAKVRDRLFIIQ